MIELSRYSVVVPSLDEPMALHSLIDGAYEPQLLRLLRTELQAGDAIFDIGANISMTALASAQVGPRGRVVAIEVSARIQPYLAENIERSGAHNITSFRCAARVPRSRSIEFYDAPIAKFGMGAVAAQFNTTPTSVRCRTLDSIANHVGIENVRLLKMDVEGAVPVPGASSRPPIIEFEFSDFGGSAHAWRNSRRRTM
jgi:FkbM family methyltransferase